MEDSDLARRHQELQEQNYPNPILEETLVYNSEVTGVKVDPFNVYLANGCILPTTKEFIRDLKSGKFEVYEDDIWIMTYPKNGKKCNL